MKSDLCIINITDNSWAELLKKAKEYDFYHTQSYHLLETDNEPVLVVVNFDDGFIALPIIIRKIENTEFYDCTSAYGYCGPVTSYNKDELTEGKSRVFQEHLLSFFQERKIISAFSRFHPIIENDIVFNDLGLIKELNKTIAIDLRLSPEEQRKQFRKSNKSEINQLKRKGYEVIEASSKEEIDAFIAIYHDTMHRLDAANMYLFSKEYFYKFLDNPCFENRLLLAVKDRDIVAGAIFSITNNIMQYHLAGTKEEFMREAPMKLILDEARLIGNSLNLDYLHLGGGVGGSGEDSLFRFKSGFSDLQFQFRIWQLIIDKKEYNSLVHKKGIDPTNNNFFPLYRSNI